MDKQISHRWIKWFPVLVILLILLIYGRVLAFSYVFDDHEIFSGKIRALLTQEYLDFSLLAHPFLGDREYFRPLTVLSFILDAYVSEFDPAFSHAVNLAIFSANSVFVFFVCKTLAERTGRNSPEYPALLAALLYAVHPACIETTVWISGRFDALATFFILAATQVFLSRARKLYKILLVSLFSFMAFLSKEIGVMLPVVLFSVWMAIFFAGNGKNEALFSRFVSDNKAYLLVFPLLLLVYFLMRFQIEGNSYVNYVAESSGRFQYGRLFLAVETLKFYISCAFFPFRVNAVHPVDDFISPWTPFDLLGNAIVLLFIGTVLFFALFRKSVAAWVFISGLFLIALVLHIVPIFIGTNIGHERFLTAPLAFWIIAVALVRYDTMFSGQKTRKLFLRLHILSPGKIGFVFLAIWISFAVMTLNFSIPHWKSDFQLWTWAYVSYPNSSNVRKQYLYALTQEERYDLLEYEFNRILNDPGVEKFSVEEQTLYALFLLEKDDPEALDWLEGIIDSIMDFHIHEQASAQKDRERLRVQFRGQKIANTYSVYSQAIFVFRKDPEKALEMSGVARWYKSISDDQLFDPILAYQEVAYLYALGRIEAGDALMNRIKSSTGEDLRNLYTIPLLKKYCKTPAKGCDKLQAKMAELAGKP